MPAQVVGTSVKLEAIVPTGVVPYNLVKRVVKLSDEEHFSGDYTWASSKLFSPAREKLANELDLKYPAMADYLRKEIKRWLSYELSSYAAHPDFKFSLVTADGSPAPRQLIAPLERELVLAKLSNRTNQSD